MSNRAMMRGCLGMIVAWSTAWGCAPEPQDGTRADGAPDASDTTDTGAPQDTGSSNDTNPPPPPDTATEPDSDTNNEPDGQSPEPIDCSPFEGRDGWALCVEASDRCDVVFTDGAGCRDVCAAAGLVCREVYENIDDQCAANDDRPALTCDPPSGHQSDYCVCVRGAVDPDPDPDPNPDPDPDPNPDPDPDPDPEVLCTPEACPAFPGAEGEGMFARGGRGGSVCHVTNTNNGGSGSFRECATSGSGALTIVFDVGGIIDLTSPLRIDRNDLTIAGQTAPGDGVVIRGYQTDVRGNNIIIQHVRFRAGDIRKMTQNRDGFTEDSLTVSGSDIIVDHVSASWGIDECLSAGSEITNLTVQYSLIAEGLHRTRLFHGEYDADHQGHSMGGLYKPSRGDAEVSLHHNLFAHNNNRNPAIGVYEDGQHIKADIRNNVIYNCTNMGYVSGGGGRAEINYIGNYGIHGPTGDDDDLFSGNDDGVDVDLYQSDNRIDILRNGQFDGFDLGWSAIGSDYDRANAPFAMRDVTTHSPDEALELVLDRAGARPWNRDSVDVRIVNDVRDGTGQRIDSQDDVGGWGTVRSGSREDRDRDGMTDEWESSNGTNPNQADNNGDVNGDGYTNLENYLHWAGRAR